MIPFENDTASEAVLCDDLALQCPKCRIDIAGLDCKKCGFRMRIHRGVVYALRHERSEYYIPFLEDYERIRAAEGRGSQNDEFYLKLPYQDATGRNSKQWRIRARSYAYLITQVLGPAGNGRRVLDLGAGNCWMSFRLALAGYLPVAVDILTNEHDGLEAGMHFERHLPRTLPRFQAEMTHLPFQSEQFDAVIFNASFHYSEDYEASVREALRCLRPGGALIVSDSPWYSRAESGVQMVAERHASFLRQYGTASDSLQSLDFLTDEHLRTLEEQLSIQWTVHSPWYGLQWALRPLVAKFRRKREPSRFRIYTARK